jgi:acetyltransferase
MRGLLELPPTLLERLTQIDYDTHQAMLAIAVENGEEIIVGEARYVADDDPASVELAVSIADRWQGKGIASLLIERLARDAAAHGYAHLIGHTLRDNDRMLHVARKAGMAVQGRSGDPTTVRLSRDLHARPEDSLALRDALIGA